MPYLYLFSFFSFLSLLSFLSFLSFLSSLSFAISIIISQKLTCFNSKREIIFILKTLKLFPTISLDSDEDDEQAFDPSYPSRRADGSIGSEEADSIGGDGGSKALLSIERNIANLEKSILNSSQNKKQDIYEADSHHQVWISVWLG